MNFSNSVQSKNSWDYSDSTIVDKQRTRENIINLYQYGGKHIKITSMNLKVLYYIIKIK